MNALHESVLVAWRVKCRATATQPEVLAAREGSGDAVSRLLRAGLENGCSFPGVSRSRSGRR